MRKQIKEHSDQNFVYGMNRYLCSGFVVNSTSWGELFEKLEKYEFPNFKNQAFNEYKLLNLIIIIEYKLATVLELFFKENKLNKNEAYTYIFKSCKIYRRVRYDKEVASILKKEIGSNQSNLFSPHVLFYVAGCSLGDLIYIFDQYTTSFLYKDQITKQLRGFNDKRNDFIHNLLSSRINPFRLLSRALSTGLKLDTTLERIIGHGYISDELVLKLKIEQTQ